MPPACSAAEHGSFFPPGRFASGRWVQRRQRPLEAGELSVWRGVVPQDASVYQLEAEAIERLG